MSVSIIVPVYNVAPYLRAGLDALLAQTARDWTAICVDDGSTDGSGAILDAYAARDARIAVLHRPHAGVSAARNAALDRARGEIVLFMDPDDTVAPDWVARMAAGLDGVDLVWGAATEECDGRVRLNLPHDVGAEYAGDAVRRRAWRAVFGYRLRDLPKMLLPGGLWRRCRRELGSVCWRGFRRTAIGSLRFSENLRLFEDAMFLAACAAQAKSLRVIGDTGYRYFIRPRGAMTRQMRENLVANKFAVRDARRAIDPAMSAWRGSFVLSAFEVLRATGSLRTVLRYLSGRPY